MSLCRWRPAGLRHGQGLLQGAGPAPGQDHSFPIRRQERSRRNRVNKLFVDYLRNGHGATTAAAFSARARPGLGVSMPISWDDLPKVKSGAHWTMRNAREYLSFQKVDPWADYSKQPQSLIAAMELLSFVPRRGKSV